MKTVYLVVSTVVTMKK